MSKIIAFPSNAERLNKSDDASGSAGLKEQRAARYDAWRKADATTSYWKAMLDLYLAVFVAQRRKLPEALGHDVVELDDAKWQAARNAWQDAADRQMLTPAPNSSAVLWKRQARRQEFCNIDRAQIEKAIADDLAWLRRYPARDRSRLLR